MDTKAPLLELVAYIEEGTHDPAEEPPSPDELAAVFATRVLGAVETYKQMYPDWLDRDDADALFVRELAGAAATNPIIVNSREAAAMLNMAKPSGNPSDLFLQKVAPKLRMDEHPPFRFDRDAVIAYAKGGQREA